MNEQEILEGNKILAGFMEIEKVNLTQSDIYRLTSSLYHRIFTKNHCKYLDFDKSWDWLIPVVEKIESIRNKKFGWFCVYINSNNCSIQSKYLSKDIDGTLNKTINDVFYTDWTLDTKLESVWKACILFIEFWNKQEK
jgi:hypothetical protein